MPTGNITDAAEFMHFMRFALIPPGAAPQLWPIHRLPHIIDHIHYCFGIFIRFSTALGQHIFVVFSVLYSPPS